MNQLKAVTYAESREAFFIKMLNKAERGLENLMKYGTSHDDRTEQGQIVAFYRDALAALREQAERSKGCEGCKVGQDNARTVWIYGSFDAFTGDSYGEGASHKGIIDRKVAYCPICSRRLEVEP